MVRRTIFLFNGSRKDNLTTQENAAGVGSNPTIRQYPFIPLNGGRHSGSEVTNAQENKLEYFGKAQRYQVHLKSNALSISPLSLT